MRGLPVTGSARTGWDLARWLDPVAAVVAVDRMLAAGAVIRPELVAYAERRSGDRGWRAFDLVLSLVDGRAESPPESELRVRLMLAGVPTPEPQHTIPGLARVDLGWPEYRLAVEYDGLWHVGSGDQMHRDRERLNRLVAAGWLVLHVTARRLREDFPGVVAEVRQALLNRGCPRGEFSRRRRTPALATSG